MNASPKTITVLLGGLSMERDVSLKTGAAVALALRETGFIVHEVVVNDEHFIVPQETELVFISLHGTFGEDGQVQEILRRRGLPYTGANAVVSRIAFDKEKTKEKFREHSVPTPQGQLVERLEQVTLPLPLFIKPNAQGSSVGTRPVLTLDQLAPALAEAWKFGREALVEQFIQGRELTIGVLGSLVLPIVEIHPHEGFYDYANKYTKGRTDYFCPAQLPGEITEKIQKYALAAHRAVGNPVYSRVDFLLEAETNPYCLEVNTIPGMTATSLLPKAAAAAGISFPELCRRIVELSWAKQGREEG